MHKRAILFDIDGTLVDSNDAHVDAWQRALAAEEHAFSRAAIHDQIGKGGDNLVPSLLPNADAGTIERLSRAEGEIYRRDYMPKVEPFEGATKFLRRLAELGHTLVLASSASRPEVDYYVDLLDAEGVLTGTTSRDDVAASKPCADIFVAALELTGGGPETAVVIGDTPYDVTAARRAGIEAIALLSGGFDRQELSECAPLAIYEDIRRLSEDYANSPLCIDRRVAV
jgi:HAD superfamily hydrolase (TIGR01509 family)